MQNDLLIFSNRSEKTLAGTLWLSDAAGKRWNQRVSLAARQTVRLNLHGLLGAAGLSGQCGGIQFEVPANAGGLDSVHLVYDEWAKSSVSLAMFSRYPGLAQHQRPGMEGKPWTSYAPMLALPTPDVALGLPSGTVLQPTILVRNTTAKPVAASVTLNWRGDSIRGQVKLADLNLAPFATQQLQIGAMQKQLGIPDDAHWALVTLSAAASPGDLVALASSYDASGRYYLDTPFSSNAARHFAGGEWRADANHNQIMAVTNSGQKPTNALLTLHYDNGQKSYEMQQAIQPGDQMWVNVASLIRNRLPDRRGNVLPADASFGTYDLRDLSPGLGSLTPGNLALDGTFGFNIKPPNAICCGTTGQAFDPGTIITLIDNLSPYEIMGTNVCTGDPEDLMPDVSDLASANPAIATVTIAGVTGVSAGTTTASGEVLIEQGVGGYCGFKEVPVQAPVTVQVPTSIPVVLTITNQATTGCDPGQAGWTRVVARQLTDQFGNPIQQAGQVITENVKMGANGLLLPPPTTGSPKTNPQGQIGDNLSFCSTQCPSQKTTTQTQTITDGSYPLGTYTLVFSCTSITVNGN